MFESVQVVCHSNSAWTCDYLPIYDSTKLQTNFPIHPPIEHQ